MHGSGTFLCPKDIFGHGMQILTVSLDILVACIFWLNAKLGSTLPSVVLSGWPSDAARNWWNYLKRIHWGLRCCSIDFFNAVAQIYKLPYSNKFGKMAVWLFISVLLNLFFLTQSCWSLVGHTLAHRDESECSWIRLVWIRCAILIKTMIITFHWPLSLHSAAIYFSLL